MTQAITCLSKTTCYLHGIVALGMIGLIALGIYMSETEQYGLYDIHKSFGVLVFFIAAIRVVWRMKMGWPSELTVAPLWQKIAAKFTHWLLILATVLFPISGMMMSGGGGHGVYLFGLQLIGENADPQSGRAVPLNESIASIGHEVHGLLTWIVIAGLILHIVGALKHHYIDKDATLKRMIALK